MPAATSAMQISSGLPVKRKRNSSDEFSDDSNSDVVSKKRSFESNMFKSFVKSALDELDKVRIDRSFFALQVLY